MACVAIVWGQIIGAIAEKQLSMMKLLLKDSHQPNAHQLALRVVHPRFIVLQDLRLL